LVRVEVEVGPRQTERLADSQPRVRARRRDGSERVAHLREQQRDLVGRQVARLALSSDARTIVAIEIANDVMRDVPRSNSLKGQRALEVDAEIDGQQA
jgi:hypothetical protein